MSEPDHRDVRVRRSPKIGVFLGLGALAGAVVALVVVASTPPDPALPPPQALGALVFAFAPIGALVTGLIAVLLDRRSERRARIVRAERTGTGDGSRGSDVPRPAEAPEAVGGIAAPAVEAADAAEEQRG